MDDQKSHREIAATPSWTKPPGTNMNYGRASELFNRFRSMCMDMAGQPLGRNPGKELEDKILTAFITIQKEFMHNP